MQEYKFEYSNQKFATKLFIICFGFFMLSFIGILGIAKFIHLPKMIFFATFLILCFGIPFFIFWLNRKKIKNSGSAKLENEKVKIVLDNEIKEIEFKQIENYLVQVYNGTLLQIKLLNGEKFKMYSNSNFCNTKEFDEFTGDLETKIQNFKEVNEITIIRKKTFFERVWIYPFLIIMTISVVIIVIYGIYKGKGIPPLKLIAVIAPILSLWAGYFGTKNRNKKE
ncbi:hypothetical protein [Flavobacterium restrictum]|uniref:Uncharacterized protein n=1 Tax=Flavobacterium restrictum TaxID=2594428 RepID=A0A553DZU9_9FLAO|nr:hypothetical protein [Flavobacterium restrictum]TRX38286.1 hypothetical protein FNW21_10980 [Flavobacterium restrictum]